MPCQGGACLGSPRKVEGGRGGNLVDCGLCDLSGRIITCSDRSMFRAEDDSELWSLSEGGKLF